MTDLALKQPTAASPNTLSQAWCRFDGFVVATWVLGFLPVAYLALRGGGYDPIVRGEVGIAIWWIVLAGAAVGVMPRRRMGTAAWVGLALLAGFAAWTLLASGWSESGERTVADLGKVAAYAGVLGLALSVQGRASVRHLLNGLAWAAVLVAAYAVLYRVHQPWFSTGEIDLFYPSNVRRLSVPLNYWNALAAFVAMGLPLVLQAATGARRLVFQALAAAAVPVMTLCVFFTFSRGGVGAVAVAVAVFLLLASDRLPRLATVLASGAGSAILIAAADQREALSNGLRTAAARQEGDELLTLIVLVAVGVGLIQVSIGLVARHARRPAWLTPSRQVPAGAAGVVALLACLVALAAGLPDTIDREWQQFKTPVDTVAGTADNSFERLESLSGNGRYQYWQSALDANATSPWQGIGSGTFEFWWARNGTISGGFIRDAHSLYAETLAELGIVGAALLFGFLLWVFGVGVFRCIRLPESEHRLAATAATAGCAAFVFMAGLEWIWEIAVLPAALMLLSAAILGQEPRDKLQPKRPAAPRVALVALALAGIVAISVPLAGTAAIRESQELARQGDLAGALAEARAAASVQPYSATAYMQAALVLESGAYLALAEAEARRAIGAESTNWRTWLLRARLRAKRGDARGAVRDYRRAQALNPRSPLFDRG